MIKRFTASQVSASEAGDYFQIHFEEGLGDDTQYLLIQRQFEDYDGGVCYVEDDELLMVDHYKILKAKLTRTYFEIKFKSEEKDSAFIYHTMTDEEFAEAKKVLKIIHPAVSIIE
jgi:uncharacterized protein VirK/YbjX